MNQYVWYNNSQSLSDDMIHQILAFGSLKDILKLKKKTGVAKLQNALLNNPKKVYTRPGLNFIKNFILQTNQTLDEKKLLKYGPRNIR